MAGEQLVSFVLGTEQYAVPISQVKEIIHHCNATKLPATPKYMEGIINVRGKIIPVINLTAMLKLAPTAATEKRIVIVETSSLEFGIVVDAVSEVIRIEQSNIEPNPSLSTFKTTISGALVK